MHIRGFILLSAVVFFITINAYAGFFQDLSGVAEREAVSRFYEIDTKERPRKSSYGDLTGLLRDPKISVIGYIAGDPERNKITVAHSSETQILGFILLKNGEDPGLISTSSLERFNQSDLDSFQHLYAIYTGAKYEGNNFFLPAITHLMSDKGLKQRGILFYELEGLNSWLFGPAGFLSTNTMIKFNKVYGLAFRENKKVLIYSLAGKLEQPFQFAKAYAPQTEFLPKRNRKDLPRNIILPISEPTYSEQFGMYRKALDESGLSYTFTGYFTPERQAEQDMLLSQMLEPFLPGITHAKRVNTPDSKERVKQIEQVGNPQFTLLAGPIASGKTFYLQPILNSSLLATSPRTFRAFKGRKWAVADADLFKNAIIQFSTYLQNGEHRTVEVKEDGDQGETQAKMLSDVHKESSYLTDLFIKILLDHGVNIVWAGTFDWVGFPDLIQQMIRHNPEYRFQMVEITSDVDTLIKNAALRAKKEGREVPKDRIIASSIPGEDVRFMLRCLVRSFVIESSPTKTNPWLRSVYTPRGTNQEADVVFRDLEISSENQTDIDGFLQSLFLPLDLIK